MDAIDVRIYEGARLALQERYDLPVDIGRSGDCPIHVASPDDRISRFHATLSARGGSLVLTDKSTNGTRYRGRLLRKAETVIENADEFVIEQYRIEVQRAQSAASEAVVFFALAHSKSRGDLPYPIGPNTLVLSLKEQRPQFILVKPKAPEAILAGVTRDGGEALAVIAAKDGFGTITTTPAAQSHKLTINRGAPRGATERLNVLDVVMVGHLRIDILKKGKHALRCKNLQCELLNPYAPGENCQYCGHKLVEAHTTLFNG